jgi:anti-sigma28 factor (negative regulator of flagellin synthesis)
MKIDNNALNLTQSIAQTQPAMASPISHGSKKATGDHVQLSDMASLLSVGQQRLEQLEQQYSTGTYSVSPSQIANGMINSML